MVAGLVTGCGRRQVRSYVFDLPRCVRSRWTPRQQVGHMVLRPTARSAAYVDIRMASAATNR